MKEINIWKFSFWVWVRFQVIIVAIGFILCIPSSYDTLYEVAYLGYFEVINAILSGIGCISYGAIVYFWIKKTSNKPTFRLEFILYQAGWVNVVFLLIVYFLFLLVSNEFLESIIPAAAFALLIILIGLLAIYLTLRKWELNELSNAKIDNLLKELGTSPQES